MRFEHLPKCSTTLLTFRTCGHAGRILTFVNELGAGIKSPKRSLLSRCSTSRDFVPWRFLDAGQMSMRSLLVAGVRKPTHQRTLSGSLSSACRKRARLGHARSYHRRPNTWRNSEAECSIQLFTRRGLDSRVPGIAKVFPIAALAPTKRCETLDRLDPHDVFCHLVAELTFDTQPQRRAMRNVQRLVIHIVG